MSTRPTLGSIRAETKSATIGGLSSIYVESVVGPVHGSFAVTLGAITLVATTSDKIHGALAKALADITLAGTGSTKLKASLAVPLGAVTLVAQGKVRGGTLFVTLDSIRLNATGTARTYGVIERRQDWPTVLAQMVYNARCEPFVWGTHDCALWSADVIQAISLNNVDLAASYRGRYSTAAGAAAVIAAATGGGDLEDLLVMVATQNNFTEVAPTQAQRGDLVLATTADGPAAGIVGPDGAEAIFVAPSGLTFLSLGELSRAWRITH
jgi:hypothetical protein